jgi:hypothetical protein
METDSPLLTRPDDTLDRACQLLFTHGAPLAVPRLAASLGHEVGVVDETVERFEKLGRIRRDSDGRIVASAGVSVVPADYELRVGSRLRWAWCAKTGLGVLGALAAGGTLRTGDLVVEFDGGRPLPSPHAVLWPSTRFQRSCQSAAGELCATFTLFVDARAAWGWARANDLDAEVITVEEATGRTVDRYRHSLGLPATRDGLLGQ